MTESHGKNRRIQVKTHAGRIDSLGLDENNSPVIIEYKRSADENVINQGLFYLDWLMDHKAEFEQLVRKHIGDPAAESVEWSSPRVICIAANFTRYEAAKIKTRCLAYDSCDLGLHVEG